MSGLVFSDLSSVSGLVFSDLSSVSGLVFSDLSSVSGLVFRNLSSVSGRVFSDLSSVSGLVFSDLSSVSGLVFSDLSSVSGLVFSDLSSVLGFCATCYLTLCVVGAGGDRAVGLVWCEWGGGRGECMSECERVWVERENRSNCSSVCRTVFTSMLESSRLICIDRLAKNGNVRVELSIVSLEL